MVIGVALFLYKDPPNHQKHVIDDNSSLNSFKLFDTIGIGELLVVSCTQYYNCIVLVFYCIVSFSYIGWSYWCDSRQTETWTRDNSSSNDVWCQFLCTNISNNRSVHTIIMTTPLINK